METERSIFLQKKMILFLSFVIVAIFSVTVVRENRKSKEENFVSLANEVEIALVNEIEDENEILREEVKFLAVSIISGEEKSENVEVKYEEALVPNELNIEENVLQEVIESGEKDVVTNEPQKVEEISKKDKTYVKYRDLAENNPPTEYESVVEASATAYCLCKKCCGKNPDHPYYGYTYSGIKIEKGTGMKVIAVDPKFIPIKSKVYVEGLNGAWDYGHAIAADTGSAIKELKIDLYMDTHEEALEWGRRKVNVYILGE